ncbi:hypothetical protein [Niveispirillum sp.]|uniref:hypothetical protein n=1 Tax=Niveispirillum sp. TaxID=1917217 RepID=UPI001B41508A|nr:hypothetical protein [Niveispirillum sp.]MBP7335623.1 hypothetical protein [Niveispirillum sp.]
MSATLASMKARASGYSTVWSLIRHSIIINLQAGGNAYLGQIAANTNGVITLCPHSPGAAIRRLGFTRTGVRGRSTRQPPGLWPGGDTMGQLPHARMTIDPRAPMRHIRQRRCYLASDYERNEPRLSL